MARKKCSLVLFPIFYDFFFLVIYYYFYLFFSFYLISFILLFYYHFHSLLLFFSRYYFAAKKWVSFVFPRFIIVCFHFFKGGYVRFSVCSFYVFFLFSAKTSENRGEERGIGERKKQTGK